PLARGCERDDEGAYRRVEDRLHQRHGLRPGIRSGAQAGGGDAAPVGGIVRPRRRVRHAELGRPETGSVRDPDDPARRDGQFRRRGDAAGFAAVGWRGDQAVRKSPLTPQPPLPRRGEGEPEALLLPLSPPWERGLGGEGGQETEPCWKN